MKRLVVALVAGCAPADAPELPAAPFLATFPDARWVVDGQLSLPTNLPSAATPIPVDALRWREGFSPSQVTVIRPPAALDPAQLPWRGLGGIVQLHDLTDGRELPCLAELDAGAPDDAVPTLLVRPLEPMQPGHEVAVWLSPELRTEAGDALSFAWFAGDDDLPPAALVVRFPVDDPTRGLRPLLEAARTAPAPDFSLTPAASEGLPATAAQYTGTFTVPDLLGTAGVLDLAPDGAIGVRGSTEAELLVHVSAAAAEAAPGEAPIWVFGHGIFSHPARYLSDPEDPSGVLALAEAAGAIVVATPWRGLTTGDITVPLNVAGDFGTFPTLSSHLAQGVLNATVLVALARSASFRAHAAFADAAGEEVRWYGISLGGIEGAVVAATSDLTGVLHVSGGMWSTMLERSSNWPLFATTLAGTIPDAADRQALYAFSQLLWDPVDPASWTDDLAGADVLWQIAWGDNQVSPATSLALARGADATLVTPVPAPADAFARALLTPWVPDTTPGGPALTVFDPQQGDPDGDNLPAPATTAHDVVRLWPGAQAQALAFLDRDAPGGVIAPCGAVPCTAEATAPPED
jgi:hypothetical protein